MSTKNTLLIVFSFISSSIFAQNDAYHDTLNRLQANFGLTGGNWILTPNELTNANNATSYGHTATQNAIIGQDFTQAINMAVSATGTNPWDAGYFNPNVNSVQQGDRVLIVLWLKTVSTPAAAPGKINFFAENNVTYHKETFLTISPTTQWQQYLIPFESSATYNTNELHIGFHLAYQQQVIEFGGLAVINYGTTIPFTNLPQQLHIGNYEGSEANASWRIPAANRIEQYRKADLQLKVLGSQGNPLANTTVRVEMLRHKYAFGTAVVPRKLANNSAFNQTYQNHIKNLDGNGHGFNWVVTENALKWRAWEQGWAGTPAETINAIQWLLNNQIQVRGHVLTWPGWGFMPADMQTNANNPNYLTSRINTHLNTILNYTGIKNKIKEWDVLNEIAHVRDLENALKGTANYTTGREVYPEIFNMALQTDPSLITYINDYNILSNGSVTGGDYTLFKSMVQEIIDAGASLNGIGFQAHLGSSLVPPDSLYAILEDAHLTFGKTIKITEYDQSDIIPDTTAAKYTGDFLTMIFSHPATDGFLMWGFWDGAHWLNNAPLYDQNWTPKPTHTIFTDLLFNQWWTDSTMTTDANGNLALRGFKGDYKITATVGGVEITTDVVLHNDLSTTISLFPVSTHPILKDEAVKLFPNPVTDYLSLELPYQDEWTVTIIDELGRQVFEKTTTDFIQFLDMRSYASGNYYLKIQNKVGAMLTKKVVVIR